MAVLPSTRIKLDAPVSQSAEANGTFQLLWLQGWITIRQQSKVWRVLIRISWVHLDSRVVQYKLSRGVFNLKRKE